LSQASGTVPDKPFGSDALVQLNSTTPPCEIVMLIDVTVRVGFTPVQFPLGHPASAPDTVGAAVKVFGFVVNVTFPFLICGLGIVVGTVCGPSSTLFCPGAMLPPWFWHW
jgi:hypothetical protein